MHGPLEPALVARSAPVLRCEEPRMPKVGDHLMRPSPYDDVPQELLVTSIEEGRVYVAYQYK
jgi:hypothetical protein